MNRQERKARKENINKNMMIIGMLIGLIIIVFMISYVYSWNHSQNEKKEGILDIKRKLCENEGGTYTKFNYTDYCYGEVAIGLVFIEIEKKCFELEEPCTFELKRYVN